MNVTGTLEKFNSALSLKEKEELRKELSANLNHLAVNDFTSLIQLLYRIDVSEQKLKNVLKENKPAAAGDLLADFIIERQAQKQAMQSNVPPPPADFNAEEERW